MSKRKIIVYEHERLYQGDGDQALSAIELKALQNFYGVKGTPYFTLINNGIKFSSYVGVLQIGQLSIEILPKTDREHQWQKMLIMMLRAVGAFKVSAPSLSDLKLKSNAILELYFELFLSETEYLYKRGLIKRYQIKEGNFQALKGKLLVGRNIQKNAVHPELFYVSYSNYDHKNKFNAVLYATLLMLRRVNTGEGFSGRINHLLLGFPEQDRIIPTDAFFNRLTFDRKTEPYRAAIDMAKLLLLNYHPDVISGNTHLLALLFDMNVVWERFVFTSLRRYDKEPLVVKAQPSKLFWTDENQQEVAMRPDLIVQSKDACFVLDTKWKVINGSQPSPDDLRQMYVYQDYYSARKVALIYPGKASCTSGFYADAKGEASDKLCGILSLAVNEDVKAWQDNIADEIIAFCKS